MIHEVYLSSRFSILKTLTIKSFIMKNPILLLLCCFLLSIPAVFSQLTMWEQAGSNIYNENLRGNVGIGTPNPTERLTVLGNASISGITKSGNTMVGTWPRSNSFAFFGNNALDNNNSSNNYALLQENNGITYLNSSQNIRFRINNSDKMRLASNGNLGIGETNPSYKLHAKGGVYADGGWFRVSGNNGIYFQSHGGGFYMKDATWIRTSHNKSFYHNTGIMRTDGTFQVGPDGGRFLVKTDGKVGIGTTNPNAKVNIQGGTDVKKANGGFLILGALNSFNMGIDNNEIQARVNNNVSTLFLNSEGGSVYVGNVDNGFIVRNSGIVGVGSTSGNVKFNVQQTKFNDYGAFITSNSTNNNATLGLRNEGGGRALDIHKGLVFKPGGGFWGSTSDKRLKKNIKDFKVGLKALREVRPVSYYYNGKENMPSDTKYVGVIAQELLKIAPDMIIPFQGIEEDKEYYSVDPSNFLYMLINAVQELDQKVIDKEIAIESLTKEVQNLQQTLDKVDNLASLTQQADVLANQQEQIAHQQQQIDQLTELVEQLLHNQQISTSDNTQTLVLQKEAYLAQNTPNPFNGNTLVDYFIPENTKEAYLQVTSVDGRQIGKVSIPTFGQGQVNIKAHTYPSGNYFYSLVVDGQIVDTKKMMLTNSKN